MDERVGTAQRNTVLDLLGKALGEGFLDLTEYEQRMIVASSARTVSQLAGTVADPPPQFRWDPRQFQMAGGPGGAMAGGVAGGVAGGMASGMASGVVGGVPPKDNVHIMSTTALVLGIISVPMTICVGAGVIFGAAAVFLSLPGTRQGKGYGQAMAGRILGIIGMIMSFVFIGLSVLGQTTK